MRRCVGELAVSDTKSLAIREESRGVERVGVGREQMERMDVERLPGQHSSERRNTPPTVHTTAY